MPIRNKRSSQSSNIRRYRGGKFNMLNLLSAFGDIVEEDRRGRVTKFKVRALLKAKNGKHINCFDEQEQEFTPEEAVQYLAESLLAGNAINFYLFINDDGSYGGNGRINIQGIEVPAPKRKTATAAKNSKRRNYEEDIRNNAADDDSNADDDDYFENLPM